MKVITFGTFDLLHIGHISILERSRELGDSLVVGVSTDALNYSKKGFYPHFSQEDRLRIIGALRCVDQVFLEESLEKKRDYVLEFEADMLVMGSDWTGKFDHLSDVCEVVYLPRTDGVSSTGIKTALKNSES